MQSDRVVQHKISINDNKYLPNNILCMKSVNLNQPILCRECLNCNNLFRFVYTKSGGFDMMK